MFLALREMRRAKVRFGLLIAAVSLLVFLILFQQALQRGLITAFIGAINAQTAPVLVYTTDSQRAVFGSVITPELQQTIEGVDGVGDSGLVGIISVTTVAEGEDTSTILIGAESPDLGGVQTLSAGVSPGVETEAVGSAADFALGVTVEVAASGGGDPVRLTVVGLARDAQLSVSPTLYCLLRGLRAGGPGS